MYTGVMNLPALFPDWVPGWAQLVVAIVVILLGLAFLLMPFSVFGLKSRLEAVETRLDEIQAEIRSLTMRLPERVSERDVSTLDRVTLRDRPPVPPSERPDPGRRLGRDARPAPGREEPRFR